MKLVFKILATLLIAINTLPADEINVFDFTETELSKLEVRKVRGADNKTNYTVGTNAKCNEPLCCRPENGLAPDSKSAAGKWGDYNCDPPIWLA